MNQLQTGRFNRLFQKLFAMKGAAAVTEVGAEILPVISIRIGAEARYLESWELFGVSLSFVATAGNTSGFRMRNPVGSNVIAVFEKITISDGAMDDAYILTSGALTTDLTLLSLNGTRLDSRGRPGPTMIASTNIASPVGGPLNLWQGFLKASTCYDLIFTENQELPLLPGDALQVTNLTNNQGFRVSWRWRERALEEAELK